MALQQFIAPGESVCTSAWLEHCGNEPQGASELLPAALPQLCPLLQGSGREEGSERRSFYCSEPSGSSHHSKGNPGAWVTAVFQSFGARAGVGENLQPIISSHTKRLTGNIFKQMSCVLTKFQ